MCKSLNFRSSKSYFSPQNAHSSFENLMNLLNNTQIFLLWSCLLRDYVIDVALRQTDDSTPVSQSRHTLRFQPIACRSIMRCPRLLTRPEMVWQAFVPDIASGQLAVFDMAETNPRKRNCCYGQCKSDERYPVKCAGVTF